MDFHTCIGAGQKTVLINAQFVLVTANHVKGNLTDHKNQFESLEWVYYSHSRQERNIILIEYLEKILISLYITKAKSSFMFTIDTF